MALFMPSQITPDVRSGLGNGTVDATQPLIVSWHIQGQSAMTSFAITIYANDATSTQKFSTGQITSGCPAYGTDTSGNPQMFSYTIPAASLSGAGITNGNEYKLIIQQWWSANDSVTQSSASVFMTRATPVLTISAIGTGGVIGTRYYTFAGNYSQAQDDTVNWFRWRIASAANTDNPFFDTGEISGTANLSANYDGFFANTNYAVRLNCQTSSGVEADTGWVNFSCVYDVPQTTGAVVAACANGTDAVRVDWSGVGYIPGTASGPYSISEDYILTLPVGSTITWNQQGLSSMSFDAPWSVIWKGTLGLLDADIFTLQTTSANLVLSYDYATKTINLSENGTVIASQSGIINSPTVTVVLTDTTLYIRSEYVGGGLYPSETLYPSATLYPSTDDTNMVDTYSVSVTYTQTFIQGVIIGGYQLCNFIEVINGIASAATITDAITDGDYTLGLNDTDYMMADFTNGLNAGTLDIGGDTLIGFALYRAQGDNPVLEKIAETGIDNSELFDYGAASQQGAYTYYLFPIGKDTYIASPIISAAIFPCWWNWTLLECEETSDEDIFSVLAAYRFRYNIQSGQMSNNNSPNVLQNFTRYPKVQLTPQNYKSATLTGLIGAISWATGQPEYVDTIALRDTISALSLTKNPLFLKNRKGDLIRVRIAAPVTMQTDDATQEQMQTANIQWVEVGSAEGVSLFALENKGVSP